jgi:hypothetical protein
MGPGAAAFKNISKYIPMYVGICVFENFLENIQGPLQGNTNVNNV